MEELSITRFWMAGVVGVMAVFAIISAVGLLRRKSRDYAADDSGRDRSSASKKP